jgi:hypothetical protein
MPEATLVVVGRVDGVSTRDGHIGVIEIDRILRGAAGSSVPFISEPLPIVTGEPRVYFLREGSDPLRLRALPFEEQVSAPLEVATRIEAEPPVVPEDPGDPWEDELAALRAHDQSIRDPSAAVVMEVAERIFSALPWVGRAAADVAALLGPPSAGDPSADVTEWTYVYHDGERGVVRQLKIHGGRVVSMQIVRTQ